MTLPETLPWSSLRLWAFRRRWNITDDLAWRIGMLMEWCKVYGVPVSVTSGHRSVRSQAALYERWVSGRSPLPAAPPGSSKHNQDPSPAVDLKFPYSHGALVVFFAEYLGLRWGGRFSVYDPVHFEAA